MLNITAIFGRNLREACARHQSIAAVCNGIGINRQQFNRYLSGQNLPNKQTLARISRFLQLSEDQLFSRAGLNDIAKPSHHSQIFPPELSGYLGATLKSTDCGLADGLYYCYFPLQNNDLYLMRTLICIARQDWGIGFTRLTLFPSKGNGRTFWFALSTGVA